MPGRARPDVVAARVAAQVEAPGGLVDVGRAVPDLGARPDLGLRRAVDLELVRVRGHRMLR
jgi:hypothetical protein